MSKYQKVGSFLLFDKLQEDQLSTDYLAGQISQDQIQNIFVLKSFQSSIAAIPGLVSELNQDYETIKSLANPNIIKPQAFVQDGDDVAAVFEYVEGKSVRAVLNKSAQDNFPFTVDHSLLIASRLCTALEYLHSKKVNEERLIHGSICPENIFISYDGEIKLQYFGLGRTLFRSEEGHDQFLKSYQAYAAPELLENGRWDKALDIFGVGLVLYEMLTNRALFRNDRNISIPDLLEEAEITGTSGEKIGLSDELKKLLLRALMTDPAQRYPSVADLRKALDLLLFSSEFSPTTFHLAFFMHSLFREQIDLEAKNVSNLKKLDVRSFIREEAYPRPVPASAATRIIERPSPTAVAGSPVATRTAQLAATGPASPPSHPGYQPSGGAVGVSRKKLEVPPGMQQEMHATVERRKERSKAPIFVGILLVLAVGGTLAYFFLFLKPAGQRQLQTQKASLPGVQSAVLPGQPQPVVQDEEKNKLKLEAESARLEAQKKDEQLRGLLAELEKMKKAQELDKKKAASAQPPAVDAVAIKKLEQEAKKLQDEKKAQQELAEQKLKEAATTEPAIAEAPTQAPPSETERVVSNPDIGANTVQAQGIPQNPQPKPEQPAASETSTPPALKEGDLVELTPDVMKPVILNRVEPVYPRRAVQKKVQGTVILRVLISEEGNPANVEVLRNAGTSTGLAEAAIDAVKKWKFRPAVKEGKRVKVWMTYPIVFRLVQ